MSVRAMSARGEWPRWGDLSSCPAVRVRGTQPTWTGQAGSGWPPTHHAGSGWVQHRETQPAVVCSIRLMNGAVGSLGDLPISYPATSPDTSYEYIQLRVYHIQLVLTESGWIEGKAKKRSKSMKYLHISRCRRKTYQLLRKVDGLVAHV